MELTKWEQLEIGCSFVNALCLGPGLSCSGAWWGWGRVREQLLNPIL